MHTYSYCLKYAYISMNIVSYCPPMRIVHIFTHLWPWQPTEAIMHIIHHKKKFLDESRNLLLLTLVR